MWVVTKRDVLQVKCFIQLQIKVYSYHYSGVRVHFGLTLFIHNDVDRASLNTYMLQDLELPCQIFHFHCHIFFQTPLGLKKISCTALVVSSKTVRHLYVFSSKGSDLVPSPSCLQSASPWTDSRVETPPTTRSWRGTSGCGSGVKLRMTKCLRRRLHRKLIQRQSGNRSLRTSMLCCCLNDALHGVSGSLMNLYLGPLDICCSTCTVFVCAWLPQWNVQTIRWLFSRLWQWMVIGTQDILDWVEGVLTVETHRICFDEHRKHMNTERRNRRRCL